MKRKSIIIVIILAILTICLIPMASSCTKASPYFPEMAIQFEPPPRMIVTADQLYNEYLDDEAAAAAKYEGKSIWITDIPIDTYEESEGDNYLIMQGYQYIHFVDVWGNVYTTPFSSLSTIILEPQIAQNFDFTDLSKGYTADVYGECQGIVNEDFTRETYDYDFRMFNPMVIIIDISKIIAISKEGTIPQAPDYIKDY